MRLSAFADISKLICGFIRMIKRNDSDQRDLQGFCVLCLILSLLGLFQAKCQDPVPLTNLRRKSSEK